MENMKQPVDDRREEHRRHAEEGDAAVQDIETGEELGTIRCHLHHGAHAGEDHGGHVKAVEPRQPGGAMVADHAHAEGKDDEDGSQQGVSPDPDEKGGIVGQFLPAVLELHGGCQIQR